MYLMEVDAHGALGVLTAKVGKHFNDNVNCNNSIKIHNPLNTTYTRISIRIWLILVGHLT